jgi:hypothetical protein
LNSAIGYITPTDMLAAAGDPCGTGPQAGNRKTTTADSPQASRVTDEVDYFRMRHKRPQRLWIGHEMKSRLALVSSKPKRGRID